MNQHYLKIAWRNLLKHKVFSFINILGLAIGIAACMIIFWYVHHENTFDQYNVHADRIARVTTYIKAPESNIDLATSPGALADELKRSFPEVAATVRLESSTQAVKLNSEVLKEEGFFKADATVFSVFSFDFLEGNPANALQKPQSVVLTQSIAKKYFGAQSALGKSLNCNEQLLQVTGVVKDRPANSDLKIDALLSEDFSKTATWGDFDLYTYVLFKQNSDLKNFEKKLPGISAKYIDPLLNNDGSTGYSARLDLEPLTEVHFSKGKLVDTPKGSRQSNYIFALLAVFILVIALLNYINLSTAKSTERAKEVGIRKVSGAKQWQLIRQFLFESFLLVTIAWLFAIVLVLITLPFLNELLQTKLSINNLQGFLFMAAIFIVTLVLAGLYPAFVLSGFKPIKVLKGSWRHQTKGVWLRKTITIAQFAIAAALIMGTTVMYVQMNFIAKADLGFNKEQLLNIYLPRDSVYKTTVNAFENELRQRPEVKGLTIGYGMTDGTMGSTYITSDGKKRDMFCMYYAIDPQFLPVFQVKLLEGRNLSDSFSTDRTEAFIVNEAFVKAAGWSSAIGKEMEGFMHKGRVVGVVKNFYYKSLHNVVEPLVMVWNTFPANTFTVKLKPQDLDVVRSVHKKYFSSMPFDYVFLDEVVNKQYVQDNITMSLFNRFTLLAIFVSSLGLYGLVALIAVQRTKEISVRKVLGATMNQLLSLMTKDFVKLILWAILIALPVAGFLMHRWLYTYAYHIELSWWMFLIPVILLLIITLLVISKEIIKTALINPVKSLRSE
ncbi:MAG: ABC transporter permease [Agriterribacter sp.]